MISETKVANAMGGNTARACDSCLVKRARWFCGADDAFLCQRCDATVHSANQLASRHERVRLKTSSNKVNNHLCMDDHGQAPVPAWQQGVTRKARTPRGNKGGKDDQAEKVLEQPMPFVPEMGIEEEGADYFLENDHESEDLEQLLCRVPIFEPFESELCNNMTNTGDHEIRMESTGNDDCAVRTRSTSPCDELQGLQGLQGLMLPSEMELAEFAADVENMLGKGLDEECTDIKGLGLLDENGKEEEYGNIGVDVCIGIEERNKLVKVEEELDHEEMECQFNPSILDWNLDCDDESAAVLLGGSTSTDQDEEKVMALMDGRNDRNEEMMMKRKWKKICLRIDYESVITAWDGQVSPWTTGVKPELNPDDGWPTCMGAWGADHIHNLQGLGEISISGGCRIGMRGDIEAQQRPGREARVLRYREKRRTRLFSKKIRYEVRKLNAEKRPRMKGRFVKRASFQLGIGTATATTATNASPYQHLKK